MKKNYYNNNVGQKKYSVSSNRAKRIFNKIMTFRELWIFLTLVLMCVFLSFSSEYFFTVNNLLNVIRQVSIIAIIAIGATFVIITGGIDLSVGSIVAVIGVVVAISVQAGINVWISFLIGILGGVVIGIINGLIITRLKVSPVITTLAMMMILRGLTYVLSGARPLYDLPEQFQILGAGYLGPIPIPIVIMIVLYICFHILLTRTRLGRYIRAVGGNELASEHTGINIKNVKLIVYIMAAVLASVGGIILASRLGSAQPTAGVYLEFSVISAALLGGTSLAGGEGTMLGTLIGALIIGLIANGLNLLNVDAFYHQIVKGLVILIAVLIDRFRVRRIGA